METSPFCLRHYRRALRRWVRITKEFLPPNEQALRALDAVRGSAALEFEEVDDDRCDVENGIEVLLGDLEKNFGEKEIYRRGGVIREYETITRVKGESNGFHRKGSFKMLRWQLTQMSRGQSSSWMA